MELGRRRLQGDQGRRRCFILLEVAGIDSLFDFPLMIDDGFELFSLTCLEFLGRERVVGYMLVAWIGSTEVRRGEVRSPNDRYVIVGSEWVDHQGLWVW